MIHVLGSPLLHSSAVEAGRKLKAVAVTWVRDGREQSKGLDKSGQG